MSRFSDGEIFAEIQENVRGVDVYVVQPTCAPVNDNLMELLIMVDALKRASAGSITAVMPYYGYGRQDRKVAPRTPITAKLVADLLTAAGVQRVVSVDLHAGQIQGFYSIPFDHLYAMPVFLDYLRSAIRREKPVFVSPDAGGVERTRAYAKRIDVRPRHRRQASRARERERGHERDRRRRGPRLRDPRRHDRHRRHAHQRRQGAQGQGRAQRERCGHPRVLSGPAVERIANSVLDEVVVSDTIPLSEAAQKIGKIKVLGVSRLLGEAIKRIHNGDSVSSLFV